MLIKYKEGDNTLHFSRDYRNVMVVYHGIINDEDDGLPLCNDKEINAIAAYVAYTLTYRDALKLRDKNVMQFAQLMKAD